MRAVIAESYERIHRSNLVGMGILPLQFPAGQNAESLKLTGEEVFEITGIRDVVEHFAAGREVKVRATADGKTTEFNALVRIDTPQEALYYANGGILQYVLRQLLATKRAAGGDLVWVGTLRSAIFDVAFRKDAKGDLVFHRRPQPYLLLMSALLDS